MERRVCVTSRCLSASAFRVILTTIITVTFLVYAIPGGLNNDRLWIHEG
jgi:hypothetical protein